MSSADESYFTYFSPKTCFENGYDSSVLPKHVLKVEIILACCLNMFLIRNDKNIQKMQQTRFLPRMQRGKYYAEGVCNALNPQSNIAYCYYLLFIYHL